MDAVLSLSADTRGIYSYDRSLKRMMMKRRLFPIVGLVSILLLTGCSLLLDEFGKSSNGNDMFPKPEGIEGFGNPVMQTETKKLNSICIYEWNDDYSVSKCWSLSDYSNLHPDTPYYLNVSGDFGNGYGNQEGFFTAEKAGPIFDQFEKLSKEMYKPEHANEDGLMVKEYYPYSIQAFYSFFDEEGKPINNTSDERYKKHKDEIDAFYVVSQEDYESIFNSLEELRQIVVKNSTEN